MRDHPYSLFFGDLHNHNSLGYGLGSLERSIDIAKTHLDFFAFTGHSSWHDMPAMEGERENHWLRGFTKLQNAWPRVQQLAADANVNKEFVSYLGFEWHSSQYGDQCVILPDDFHPLVYPDNVAALRAYCASRNGLMIPHHLAYKQGHRGVNWDVFDPSHSPVVEIFSEHGNGLYDRGSHPYFSHSMGGRITSSTARCALDCGKEFGFVASSDTHRGFPGAFGEGLMGVWANELTRSSIFEAIRARRTVALTGDKINVMFSVNGEPLGSTIFSGPSAEVDFLIAARDEIEIAELVVNGQVEERYFPESHPQQQQNDRCQIRVEWGWGPWTDMELDRICDWNFSIGVEDGLLESHTPCLRSGPFDETRRHQFNRAGNSVDIRSYTGRQGAFRDNPNHELILSINGTSRTRLSINISDPAALSFEVTLGDLHSSSESRFMGPFPAESMLIHRPIMPADSTLSGQTSIHLDRESNYVYLRVKQRNGQEAWASPVFIKRK